MVNVIDENNLRVVRFKGLSLIDDLQDQEDFLRVIDRYARMVVPPQQQMEYSSLIPNYSAPSSVCTSDSGGGGSGQGRIRTVRLHRRLVANHGGPPNFGFSVRGGREHGTGFFVSAVEQGSEAHCQGLRIGDQIVRINGYSVVDAIHREVLRYIKSQNHLELRVRTVGMIPVKDKRTDPLTWRVVEDDRLHSPPAVCNGNNEDLIRDVRIVLNVAPRTKLGCGICKGPEWKPGIFVQFTKENGLAREAGLRPGDQIIQCNGVPFIDIPFSDAVNVLKTSRQLDLIVRKGAGMDLFPGESSGYNSSASSVNGDQSPSWGDTKRLSIVKEESVELEERLGQLDSNHRNADKHHSWDRIEQDWDKTETKQRRKDSPVLRVHFEENGNQRSLDEANRDMSELSLGSSERESPPGMNGQHAEQKSNADGAKLAEIRMVSQQLETKTVVVEVHRSEEVDDGTAVTQSTQRLGTEEESKQHGPLAKSPSSGSFVSVSSSSAGSSLSSAISQELQRRSKRRENEGYRETERKKDILKAIDGEKRQQHEQLMDEFKRVHRKMFAHTVLAENGNNTCCHTEASQLKISQSMEERESFKTKRAQNENKEEKVSHQTTLVTTNEHSFRDRQGVSDVREVTIVTRRSTDVPPPPPPMPTSESESSGSPWKPSSPALSFASSGKASLNGRPPSCPTPDYDTSSSSSMSSPSASLIIVNKKPPVSHNSSPVKPSLNHNSSSYSHVNTNAKPLLNPQSRVSASSTKTSTPPSQTAAKNSDSVEMQSIESFTLTNPHSTKPKPPETYFVPVRNKTKPQNPSDSTRRDNKQAGKQRPVSITIGEYPSGVERRVPTRFDFLPTNTTDGKKTSVSSDGSNITCQLQSELAQTLSRSNLRKQTDLQEPLQNGISKETSSAKGVVTISVNCPPPVKNHSLPKPPTGYINAVPSKSHMVNGTNKVHIESNNNSRSKISIVSSENKAQVPPTIKPAIRNAADKLAKSLGNSNRVTITLPNGVEAKE
ncbi:harmonin isoform X2 [Periplaneta americana]|uniref:harmonin isoform X2 n=1 Tax=Periplaneta americana TaxID=6978 RepID=UPI0037E97397